MNVFLCESIHPAALELLKSRAEVVSDWAELGRVHAIINRNLKLPREVLQRAPALKVIAVHGTGSDGIDMEYCAQHGITVLYVPYENADSVAELIVALSLTLLRKLHLADRLVTSGAPIANAPPQLFGRELAGKTLGLVGAGDIALRAARIMQAGFRVNVIGYSPSLTPERAEELGIACCATLDDVLRNIDEICAMGGEDIVGFGSDFDGIEVWPEGLAHPGDFPALIELLRDHGYRQEQLEKIAGLNFWRVLKEAEAMAEK